jgi:hypothetical protein
MRRLIKPVIELFLLISAFSAGYHWPRDVELESTAPVVFTFEVTPEAARYLVPKAIEGLDRSE